MKVGVIYGRVSSEDQDYSRQIEELKTWAKALNIEIRYVFAEKLSGSRTKASERPEYMRMQEYIEQQEIKHIFCWELSRLGRNNREVVNFFEDTVERKVWLYVKKDNLITLDDRGNKTTTATLTINILSALGEMETEQLSARIKSGKLASAKKGGDFTKRIYGYNSLDKRPVINEEQAKNVIIIFQMLADGIGCRSIANYLNTHVGDKKWKGATVHSIARNSFFKGERRYKDFIIPVPAIVTSELWQKANDSLNSKKQYAGNKNVNVNLLQGVIKCKKCGSTMYQIVNPTQRVNLYKCSNGCKVMINRPWLYFVLRHHVEKVASEANDVDKRKQLETDKELREYEISSLEDNINKSKTRLDALLDVYLDGDITRKKYHYKKENLEGEISRLRTKVLTEKDFIESVNKTLNGDLQHFSDDDEVFKSEISKILEYVIVWDKIVEIKIKGWFKHLFLKPNGAQIGWMVRNGQYKL